MPTALDHNYTTNIVDIDEKITYTIQHFLFLSFPINSKSPSITTIKDKTIYSRNYQLQNGVNLEVVIFSNSKQIPTGMYARRLMSFVCKKVLTTRLKTISVGENQTEFLRDVLGIKYKLGSKERKTILEQINAFFTCFISIKKYTKDKVSVDYKNINLFTNISTIENLNKEWIATITLTEEFYNCILDFPVPIDQTTLDKNTNARKVDIINYLNYRNFLAYNKKTEVFLPFRDLKEIFGYDIESDRKFRQTLSDTMNEIISETKLNIVRVGIKGYRLHPPKDALLEERKIIDITSTQNLLSDTEQSIIDALKNKYNLLEIKAAIQYAKEKNADNLRSYVISSFNSSPRWHTKVYFRMITEQQKMLKIEFDKKEFEEIRLIMTDFIKKSEKANLETLSDKEKYILQDLIKGDNKILSKKNNMNQLAYMLWLYQNNNFIAVSEDDKVIETLLEKIIH